MSTLLEFREFCLSIQRRARIISKHAVQLILSSAPPQMRQ
jgi:hypothetical protein